MLRTVLSGPTTCSGLIGGSWALSWSVFGSKSAIRASKSAPRALQEGPRDFQEALKRLFEGFRVEDEIGNRF